MARREIQVFNMSFLDLMTDALGAVMILFLLVPKGKSVSQAVAEKMPIRGELKVDTSARKIWGDISFWQGRKLGDTVAFTVGSFEKFVETQPGEKPDPPKFNAYLRPNEVPVDRDTLERLRRNQGTTGEKLMKGYKQVPADAEILPKDKIALDKNRNWKEIPPGSVVCEAAKCGGGNRGDCDKRIRAVCLGQATFQISWDDDVDNLDIFVKNRDNNHEVSYKNRKDPSKVGEMVKLRDWLGDGVKNTEIVFQKKIIAGTYEISAMVYKSKKSEVEMFAAVSTRTDGKALGSRSIPANGQRVPLGTVTIGSDGSVR